eukprot:CAMPEP_0170276674 /NCGR_PEP_ID=MMETSP0116_2-20130129/38322_1 /TAXON_ID=400756 /ORGANISM="Durinskia baltica, Strain CSIRO CS-38" /LENGTH=94 /DNA_ID=CAMNT_0010527947 /DNA_START=240 /DNA_END=521 /DNA_ORIENTATION=+
MSGQGAAARASGSKALGFYAVHPQTPRPEPAVRSSVLELEVPWRLRPVLRPGGGVIRPARSLAGARVALRCHTTGLASAPRSGACFLWRRTTAL